VVSAVAHAAQEHFGFLVNDFQRYLKAGLEKFQEKDVFKVSLDYISQLSKSCKSEFEPFIPEIITPLIFCLNKADFSNDLKVSIFETLGDIALYSP
jgi:hypothetical protein